MTGKEVMLQASLGGFFGQAFTDAPSVFRERLRRFWRSTRNGTNTLEVFS